MPHGQIIFYLLLAALPGYFINRWMIRLVKPRESFSRFLIFVACMLAIAILYTAAVSFLLFRFVWPIK